MKLPMWHQNTVFLRISTRFWALNELSPGFSEGTWGVTRNPKLFVEISLPMKKIDYFDNTHSSLSIIVQ